MSSFLYDSGARQAAPEGDALHHPLISIRNGRVVVERQDGDRCVMTLDEAAEAFESKSRNVEALREIIDVVLVWASMHLAKIKSAFLTHYDGVYRFVVVRKDVEIDDDFQDAASDLEWNLAHGLDANEQPITGPRTLFVMLLPNCDEETAESFLGLNALQLCTEEEPE